LTGPSPSYSQNFDSLATSGTNISWTNNSTLTGWNLFRQDGAVPPGGVAISTYNGDDGGSSTGSFYSYGTASTTERAFGGLGSGGTYYGSPASGAVAGWIAVQLRNNTGNTLTSFTLSFNGEQWRNGGNTTAQTMKLEYGIAGTFNGVTWTAPGGNFNWTSVVNTATAAAVDGNVAGRVNGRGGTISNLTWISGASLWIRWVEVNDANNDHGLAIDDLSFSATVAPQLYWDLNGTTAGIGGVGPGTWDSTSLNWNTDSGGTGQSVPFGPASTAVFGGTAGTVNIIAGGVNADAGVRFDSSGYTIASGGGVLTLGSNSTVTVTTATHTATINAQIAGSNGLTKAGAGTLILGGNNTGLDGVVAVNGGTLKLANAGALGTTTSGTTVASGATLDLNGQAIGAEPLSTNGRGVGNNGALVNSSATPASFAGAITLAGNTYIGGTGNITLSNSINGSFGLNKIANNVLTLTGSNGYTGTTNIDAGSVFVNGTHTGAGLYGVAGTGTVGGNGAVTLAADASVTIGDGAGGSVGPGPAPSTIGNFTLTTSGTGATVLAGGGSDVWDSDSGSDHSQSPQASAPGTPGTNWDTLTLQKLSITATGVGADTFKIVVSPLAGFLASQDPDKPGKWKIASFTSIAGFDPSKFLVDVSAIPANLRPGPFSVGIDLSPDGSGELELNYAPEPSLGGALAIAAAVVALRRRARSSPSRRRVTG
jgi:autotransporter-associated beta strand protein